MSAGAKDKERPAIENLFQQFKKSETERRSRDTYNKTGYQPPPDPSTLCLTPVQWAKRKIPPPDRLLGDLFSTTTRCQLAADSGLGKTMLQLAWNFAMRLGESCFLHWQVHRPSSVLIIDGEMPAELLQIRLDVAASWFGAKPPADRFHLLSREDVEDMPPLDTPDGARWLLDFLDKVGHVDHVTFDNLAALTTHNLRETDGEAVLKDLRREITKRNTGQLWIHHTGLETGRGYGDKSREWFLDTVMVGAALDDVPDADVAMQLRFPKCRRRTPDNRGDFETVDVILSHGVWSYHSTDDEADPARERCLKVMGEIASGSNRRSKLVEQLTWKAKTISTIVADCRKRGWLEPDCSKDRGKARPYVLTKAGQSELERGAF